MLNDAFIFVIQWLLKKHLIYFQYINQVFQQDVEGGISTSEIIQRAGKAVLLKGIDQFCAIEKYGISLIRDLLCTGINDGSRVNSS